MPDRRERKGLALGWGVSLALHALVVIGGFVLVWSIQRTPDTPYATEARVVVFNNPGLLPEPTDTIEPTDPGETSDSPDTLFDPNPAERVARVIDEPIEPPAVLADPTPRVETPALEEPAVLHDAEFFGTGASDAKRIVYIVDASGSSIALFPAIARELERSLLALNATQKATVIAARGRPARGDDPARGVTERAPGDGLVRATTSKARAMARWFATGVTPSGRSDLLLAFREALELEPDAVFLVAIPPNASTREPGFLDDLDRLNPIDDRTGRRRTIIAVVCVGAPAYDDPLHDLSRLHNRGAEPEILDRNALLETQ